MEKLNGELVVKKCGLEAHLTAKDKQLQELREGMTQLDQKHKNTKIIIGGISDHNALARADSQCGLTRTQTLYIE